MPRDTNQLAKLIVDQATCSAPLEEKEKEQDKRNPAAVALGRLGGMKGGKARAASMSKKARSEAAREAALARWKRSKD